MPRSLRHDRAHDYKFLIRRWRALAPKVGFRIKKYAEAGGYDLFYLERRKPAKNVPSIYFSAGIHGDEPAATEGLFEWAEKNPKLLQEMNFLIFPCINPWALVNNSRRDAEGHDLNRSYRTKDIPQINEQLRLMASRKFDLALALHEDYDALGVYMYEVCLSKPYWGDAMLKAAARFIRPDPRKKIEGRAASGGAIRPVISVDLMPDWPEAFILHFQNVPRIFTVETPSEFHLDDRVAAHVAILSKAVDLCRKEFSLPPRPAKAS